MSNDNNIIVTIKETKSCVFSVILLAKDDKKQLDFLAKDLKDPCIGMSIKQRKRE